MPSRPRFFKISKTWSFEVAFLAVKATKCTKIHNARAQLLFCSLNLLFDDVAVASVVYLSSLTARKQFVGSAFPCFRTFASLRRSKKFLPHTELSLTNNPVLRKETELKLKYNTTSKKCLPLKITIYYSLKIFPRF